VKSWTEISEERLVANYRVLAEAAGKSTEVMAVVKADAYGHGAEVCAVALARAGATWLGVADAKEGTWVRGALAEAGISGAGEPRILVMCGFLRESVAVFVAQRLTPVVWTVAQVELLRGTDMRVHVEMGMGRQGVRPGVELDAVLDAIAEAGLVLDGLLTHFCAAEVMGSELTHAQERRFAHAVDQVKARGMRVGWVHAGSSSSVDDPGRDGSWLAALAGRVGAQPMVRCGISLYGYCSAMECGEGDLQLPRVRSALLPVMTWKTRVLDVREVAAGESIGYNATYTAGAAMRVALLPVGYSDGLRRSLWPGGWVMVRGQRAAIVGRVSMNLTTVDVTGIPGVLVGDEVVLLGDGVTADDHARLAGTIAYEILCGVRQV
jgi:alanine racemase